VPPPPPPAPDSVSVSACHAEACLENGGKDGDCCGFAHETGCAEGFTKSVATAQVCYEDKNGPRFSTCCMFVSQPPAHLAGDSAEVSAPALVPAGNTTGSIAPADTASSSAPESATSHSASAPDFTHTSSEASASSPPARDGSTPVVKMKIGLPLGMADFTDAVQDNVRRAIAAAAGVDPIMVRILSVVEGRARRRLLAGSIALEIAIDMPPDSPGGQESIIGAMTADNLNRKLAARDLPQAQILEPPVIVYEQAPAPPPASSPPSSPDSAPHSTSGPSPVPAENMTGSSAPASATATETAPSHSVPSHTTTNSGHTASHNWPAHTYKGQTDTNNGHALNRYVDIKTGQVFYGPAKGGQRVYKNPWENRYDDPFGFKTSAIIQTKRTEQEWDHFDDFIKTQKAGGALEANAKAEDTVRSLKKGLQRPWMGNLSPLIYRENHWFKQKKWQGDTHNGEEQAGRVYHYRKPPLAIPSGLFPEPESVSPIITGSVPMLH